MAAAREYSITYNGLTIPSVISGVQADIHDMHNVRKSSTDFEASFQVILHSAPTAAALAAACITLEDTFREPLSDITIVLATLGGGDTGTPLNLRTSANEAIEVIAEIEKVGSEADSARSRLYEINISGELPWTLSSPGVGRQGLREFEFNLEFSSSRRGQITFTGEYTVQAGGTSGTAQHNANITALITPILAGLTGTWPAVDQPTAETQSTDRADQVLGWSRTYKELIFAERVGAIDDPDVLDQRLTIDRNRSSAESTPDENITEAPQRLTATYEANIDQTNSKNLKSLWETRLRDWVLENIRNATNAKTIRLVSENLTLDPVDNIISATLEFEGFIAKGFVKYVVQIATEMNTGHIISRTWPTAATRTMADYDPTKAYVFDGPREIRQTITTTRTSLGRTPGGTVNLLKGGSIQGPVGGTVIGGRAIIVIMSRSFTVEERREGVAGLGDVQDFVDEILTVVIELIEKV